MPSLTEPENNNNNNKEIKPNRIIAQKHWQRLLILDLFWWMTEKSYILRTSKYEYDLIFFMISLQNLLSKVHNNGALISDYAIRIKPQSF